MAAFCCNVVDLWRLAHSPPFDSLLILCVINIYIYDWHSGRSMWWLRQTTNTDCYYLYCKTEGVAFARRGISVLVMPPFRDGTFASFGQQLAKDLPSHIRHAPKRLAAPRQPTTASNLREPTKRSPLMVIWPKQCPPNQFTRLLLQPLPL